MFGAIPAKQIAEEFNKTFNVELDRRKFQLAAPIRALGYTRVPVKLHHDVTSDYDCEYRCSIKLKLEKEIIRFG